MVNNKKEDYLLSLYNFLLDTLEENVPIYINLNGNVYSNVFLPKEIINSKLKIFKIENNEINDNKTNLIKEEKEQIKDYFSTFKKQKNKAFYTNINYKKHFSITNYSDEIINKIYKFLINSLDSKYKPVIYFENIKISLKDVLNNKEKISIYTFYNNINKKILEENFKYSKKYESEFSNIKFSKIYKKISIA